MSFILSKMHPTRSTGAAEEKAEKTVYADETDHQQPAFRFFINSLELATIGIGNVSLFALMIVTTGLSILFHCEPHAIELVKQKELPFWILYGLVASMSLISVIIKAITQLTKARRLPWQWNVFLLGVFTVSQSFVIAINTVRFKCDELFLALAICAVVYLGVPKIAEKIALRMKWKIWGGILLYAVLLALVLVILDIFILPDNIIEFCCTLFLLVSNQGHVVSNWVF